jgi:hypothetical protein
MDAKLNDLMCKLMEAAALLRDSKYNYLAESYETFCSKLASGDFESQEFKNTLFAIRRSLAGMGSFSDVPLVPQQGPMTKQQARERQYQLVQEIYEIIVAFNVHS